MLEQYQFIETGELLIYYDKYWYSNSIAVWFAYLESTLDIELGPQWYRNTEPSPLQIKSIYELRIL